jgi:RNA polymerase sigma-70 factor (ECF subfamily)
MSEAQGGDASAYEALLRELVPYLRTFVRRRLADDVGAEDVVQGVLLAIHRARHTYRPERPFEAWLVAIARNAVRDYQRSRRRRVRREHPLPDADVLQAAGSPSDDPWRAAGSWFSKDVEQALAKLPATQREVVLLLHGQGMSVAEAALRTRVSPGALKARAHRAYTALRALLQEALRER